ncbi:MAG: hypothetical protein Q8K72_21280 [Acidimicrobiales bacterium]|nr:hypothetical protein [Acidimicrobiales bacterium]
MIEGKARISLQHALDNWSQQVQMALGRANRVEASKQFKEAGHIDPPVTTEKLRMACAARKTLVEKWASVGSELFPDLGRPERTEIRRGRIRQRL